MFIGPSLFHCRVIFGGMEGAGGKQRQQTSNPLTPEQKNHTNRIQTNLGTQFIAEKRLIGFS